MKYYSLYFGQAYGEGNYGDGTYSCTAQQQADGTCAAGAGSTSGGGSGLADTGVAIAAIVTIACLILFVAMIVRIWRRKPALQEAEVTEESDESSSSQRTE
jgi:hypothetical protein